MSNDERPTPKDELLERMKDEGGRRKDEGGPSVKKSYSNSFLARGRLGGEEEKDEGGK
ncbi:hypothetical protein ACFFF3_03595 [Mongoliitalea lutea]|uniref:hypothetical protein n=1 Tax=Mongoliitalea lutea TaxID=849756 RepID=UPI0035E9F2F6